MTLSTFKQKNAVFCKEMSTFQQFKCERCGYTPLQKCDLVRHLKKKVECPSLLGNVSRDELLMTVTKKQMSIRKYECTICDSTFASRQARHYHMKKCQGHPSKELITLHDKVVNMEKELASIKTSSVNNINTTNNNACSINNGTVINQNIQINGLGKEDIRYITEDPKFREFMTECIRGKVCGLMDYMVKKHFDPNHPENHNVRKLNKKEDFMEVFDGKKWRTQFSDEILEDVFRHMQTDFANFVDEALTEDGLVRKAWLDTFMEKVGAPLEWDLYCEDGYEYDGELTEEEKEVQKLRIYRLACRYVYDNSCHLKKL